MDTLTPEERSRRMGLVRSANTKPEITVRRLIHSLGYRFRVNFRGLPGRPDLVFTKRRKVIFVHGCFWHRHPSCKLARLPKSRPEFWIPKLEGNAQRDAEAMRQLSARGWEVLVVWECEVRGLEADPERITSFLGPTR